ncbi:MAG: tetratricopeptide repeat protein [Candidatus Thorarchaeota archaeon]
MGNADDLFQRAVVALSDEDLERAEQLTKELLELDPEYIDGWSLLANIYQQNQQYDQAVAAAIQATTLDPKNLQFWNNLGYLYLLQSNWIEGEKCYAKALTLPDPPPTIFLNHAWALIELGEETRAKEQLQQALTQSLEDTLIDDLETNVHYAKLRPLLKQIK